MIGESKTYDIFLKTFIVFCLLIFFVTKPFIVKSLSDSKSIIELCEEEGQENESEVEVDFFETDVPCQCIFKRIEAITGKVDVIYILNYTNEFKPQVSSPPPEIV